MRGSSRLVAGVVRQRSRHVLLPQLVSCSQINADKIAYQVFYLARIFSINAVPRIAGDQDFMADDDWAGGTRTRQRNFPGNIRLGRPLTW